jgi:hypothetical protein
MDGGDFGYEENLAAANDAQYGEDGAGLVLSTMADSIAGSAADPEDALEMCRDLANSEDLNEDGYLSLVALVEGATGWELAEEGERF